jgi:maltooligosyltrehalose trehalohydrolase
MRFIVTHTLPIGAQPDRFGTRFRVWAANASRVDLLIYKDGKPAETHAMTPKDDGYFEEYMAGAGAGTRYAYSLDGGDPRPDPASRFQPAGVHGPSQVVDPTAFRWTDGEWRGIPLEEAIFYEVHVGTATPEGTFDSLIGRLDDIHSLGVTAIEIMPIADFPGNRNWGYDGVSLFAPANAYGGPEALRRLVNAAHQRGLAVVLDVVYNHLGPDGNYLQQFSTTYFTSHHKTPWGDALNFDTEGSRQVRDFFIANACHWANEYHLDGFRMDATHAIKDDSTPHILAEIVSQVRDALPKDRHFLFIAEDERNEPTLVRSLANNGYGLDAVWADDFHHEVRVALTGEHEGYYADFSGAMDDLATTLQHGWFFTGQQSQVLEHPRGAPADDVPPMRFVHCIQNHDQIGNRALGERLSADIAPDAYRAASLLLLLSPYTPLLFQGQEWAASTPFLYFTDHHAELGRLVTEGRRAEFARFSAFSGEQVPDPQAAETFQSSKLNWSERSEPAHNCMLLLYRDLLALRRSEPALQERRRGSFAAEPLGKTALALRRTGDGQTLLLVVNVRDSLRLDLAAQNVTTPPAGMMWVALLDSEDAYYGGRGAAELDGTTLEIDGPGAVLLRAVGR